MSNNKEFDKLICLADEIDDNQFMDFAVRYMRSHDREKLNYSCGRDNKVMEEVKIIRKTTRKEEES